MALLWLEGFDWIDNDTNGSALETILRRKGGANSNATQYGNARILAGKGGGQCMGFRTAYNFYETPALQTEAAGNTWIIGFAMRKMIYNQGDTQFLRICDSGNNTRFGLSIINDTVLRVDGQAALEYVTNALLVTYQWYYFEVKVVVNDSPNGSYEVKRDGVTIASGTSVDTAYGSNLTDHVRFYGAGTNDSTMMCMDDIYICDASGTINNDFLGAIKVAHLAADADGDDEQWTTSSGTDSYALINETSPADDDSDYIEDSTTGNRSIFTFGNVPSGQTGIVGINQWSNARITDATTYTLKNTIKSNGTLYPKTGQSITNQSFDCYTDISETDPDTGVAWTESGLNAIQAGVEVG